MKKAIFYFTILLLFSTCKKESLYKVATPTFSPTDTSHFVSAEVTINCETEDAAIYYTVDGSDPTRSSRRYLNPVTIESSTTIKAFAVRSGMEDSRIASKIYSIDAAVEWQILYGGSEDDEFNSIQQTSDGGYIAAGSSSSTDIAGTTNHGENDCYVVKLSSDGETEWQKLYGGNGYDCAYDIKQTGDGGYIIIGASTSADISGTTYRGEEDCYIIKINSGGDIEWQNLYGGNGYDHANYIKQTDGGGYLTAYLSRSSSTDNYTIKIVELNSDGSVASTKSYYGLSSCFDDEEYARFVEVTDDGGCIITGALAYQIPGNSYYSRPWRVFIVKLDSDAGKEWQQATDALCPFSDGGIHDMIQTSDDKYFLIGRAEESDVDDGYLIKVNSGGSITSELTFGGSGNDCLNSISSAGSGYYITSGYSYSTNIGSTTNSGSSDAYLMNFYSTGSIRWQQLYGGSSIDYFNSALKTSDGGYIAAGSSFSDDISGTSYHGSGDGYIVKISSD
ncbi:MAG: chitobiase/beta-hexosaminidase C-terminal domain-containing protein [Bacteroidales bacterium]|nr:chitobiase/beta-hexosaminidase C-terminal domain-containing protein [Bacteroidales bacterium]